MADDILTRNEAGELAVRTTQTTGDTGTNKDDVYTRDSQGRLAVRTTGNGGGGSGGASSAADLSVDPSGMSVITSDNAQSAFQELDSATKALQDSVSVLTTSAELSTEIGGTTTVALSELTAMDIDGRPSYKQAGATVYAENGVVGIVDTVDSTNAVITTVQYSVGGGAGGDYLPLSGGTLSGTLITQDIIVSKDSSLSFPSENALNATFGISITRLGVAGLGVGDFGGHINTLLTTVAGHYYPNTDGTHDFGQDIAKWRTVYATKLNNGADVAVPTTGGTMVVATPPTDNGTYVLKATVVDGVITTEWVLES